MGEATSSDEHGGHGLGVAMVLGAAVLWSLGGVGIKRAEAAPLAIAGYRSLFALPIVGGFAARQLRSDLGAFRPAIARPSVWIAGVSYAATVTLFVLATRLTTAANAILLQYTAPIYVALLSWPVLRERLALRDVLAAMGCLAGVYFFFGDKLSADGMLGNALALVSGIGFGALPVLLRRIELAESPRVARVAPMISLVLGNALVVAVAAPFMLAGPGGARSLLILFSLGTLQIGAAYVLFAAGMRRVRALEGMLLSMIEPMLNPVWVVIGAGERPTRRALIGGAFILGSVVLHAASSARAKATAAGKGR
jgi:drug/metabolite transporter (DMT)-like permease